MTGPNMADAISELPDPALTVSGLTKVYRYGHLGRKKRVGVADLSLDVRRGEVFGCIGPNGSGKTTTIKAILGLTRPDAGRIVILGHEQAQPAWRYRIGFLPEHPYFYDYLTPAEYLDYAGRLLGMSAALRRERSDELLSGLGLAHARNLALRRFSKGMVQRIGLAQALLNDPDLVILDEPMSGLDPLGRHLVREVILGCKRAGKSVFFSTHILPDAEALCDRVALLRAGRLDSVGRLDEILKIDVSHIEVLVSGLGEAFVGEITTPVKGWQVLAERLRIEAEEASLGGLLREVDAAGGRILAVQPVRRSLEDYFIEHVGAEEEARWAVGD